MNSELIELIQKSIKQTDLLLEYLKKYNQTSITIQSDQFSHSEKTIIDGNNPAPIRHNIGDKYQNLESGVDYKLTHHDTDHLGVDIYWLAPLNNSEYSSDIWKYKEELEKDFLKLHMVEKEPIKEPWIKAGVSTAKRDNCQGLWFKVIDEDSEYYGGVYPYVKAHYSGYYLQTGPGIREYAKFGIDQLIFMKDWIK